MVYGYTRSIYETTLVFKPKVSDRIWLIGEITKAIRSDPFEFDKAELRVVLMDLLYVITQSDYIGKPWQVTRYPVSCGSWIAAGIARLASVDRTENPRSHISLCSLHMDLLWYRPMVRAALRGILSAPDYYVRLFHVQHETDEMVKRFRAALLETRNRISPISTYPGLLRMFRSE